MTSRTNPQTKDIRSVSDLGPSENQATRDVSWLSLLCICSVVITLNNRRWRFVNINSQRTVQPFGHLNNVKKFSTVRVVTPNQWQSYESRSKYLLQGSSEGKLVQPFWFCFRRSTRWRKYVKPITTPLSFIARKYIFSSVIPVLNQF